MSAPEGPRAERNGGGAEALKRAPPGFREPPNNVELEQLLLGAVIVNQDSAARVRSYLKPEHFYEPRHARIFEAVSRVNGRLFDYVQLGPEFNQAEEFRELGGAEYIMKLAEVGAVYRADQADEFARELVELSSRRHLIDVAQETINRAFDLSIPESVAEQLDRVRNYIDSLAKEAPTRAAHPCDLPSLDWSRVANEEPPPERWLIEELIPRRTSGIITGPGAAGKSFLELIRLICLATGTAFLRHYQVEPVRCIGYFAEDSEERLWRRVRQICAGLEIDPARLIGQVEIISTVGAHRHLLTSEAHSPSATPTEWMHQVHDRIRAFGAHYVSFDHVGRYLAINRNDPNQVFSAFGHLDAMANSIDGSLGLLAHPSKTDMRAKAKQGGNRIVSYVGGCAAMIDAPRWVEVLDTVEFPDGEKCRVLINEKQNYSRRFAARLHPNRHGVDEFAEEVDPDSPTGDKSNNARGRPSGADRTFATLEELFAVHRRAIAVDEIIDECIRLGVWDRIDKETTPWRGKRRTVRKHLERFSSRVEERETDTFIIKP